MIQNARITWLQGSRSSAIRAILLLTTLGISVGLWPGIFEFEFTPERRLQRVWGSIILGSAGIATYLPALRWHMLHQSGAWTIGLLAPGFPLRFVLGVWVAATMAGCLPLAAGLTLACVGHPPVGGWLTAVVTAVAAIALSAAMSLALSTWFPKTPVLLIIAALWITAAATATATSALPAPDVLSIILPPLRLFSSSSTWPADGGRSSVAWPHLAMATASISAGLAAAVGTIRFRWR